MQCYQESKENSLNYPEACVNVCTTMRDVLVALLVMKERNKPWLLQLSFP